MSMRIMSHVTRAIGISCRGRYVGIHELKATRDKGILKYDMEINRDLNWMRDLNSKPMLKEGVF